MNTRRPPLLPFTLETAVEKVRPAEDRWNSRTPEKVALAYSVDRSRRLSSATKPASTSTFAALAGHPQIALFLGAPVGKQAVYRTNQTCDGVERAGLLSGKPARELKAASAHF